MLKKLMLGVVALVGLMALILGANFLPFLKTARSGLQSSLEGLVDKYELKLNQAEDKVANYETAIFDQASKRSKLNAMVQNLDRDIETAQLAMDNSREELASLRTRLKEHGFVSTRDGEMSKEQVQAAIERNSRVLKTAQQRIETLGTLRTPCEQQLAVLTRACELAPEKMQELKTLCEDLKSKIVLAREMKDWTRQMHTTTGSSGATTEEIVKSLRDIEVDIDGEIAGLSALLSIQNGPQSTSPGLSTEALISRCELALRD